MDILHCESYYQFVDYHYTGQDGLPSGIVHVDIQAVPEFFKKIIEYPDRKYVVVSSRCDFGLCYQSHFPAWKDLISWCSLMAVPDLGYSDILINARVKRDTCKLTDKYSIKCYSMTSHTFDEIPKNIVKWFMTQCGILDDERIVGIPFGVNVTDGDRSGLEGLINHQYNGPRDKIMYINYSLNSFERVKLRAFYQNEQWVTIKDNIKQKEYLDDLKSHKFALCPVGNGIDQYRIWEAIHCGCIPVVEINECTSHLCQLNLPILAYKSLINLNPSELNEIYSNAQRNWNKFNLAALTESYWRNTIQSKRTLLSD